MGDRRRVRGAVAVIIFVAPIALLLGVVAVADIRRSGRGGMGRAIFGIVMGAIGTALLALLIIGSAFGDA